jgi:hypothetical protein
MLYARRLPNGRSETIMAEIKPMKESPYHSGSPARTRGKSEKRRIQEALVWGKNKCKWEAAEAFCKAKGWRFVVLTEHELGIKR